MGISETIIAAMIGAIATVSAALFQLVSAFRARAKPDAKPKRGLGMRSILAVLALMIASAAGGFLYSEFVKQQADEDLRAMRQEIKELRQELLAPPPAVAPPQEMVEASTSSAEPQVMPASLTTGSESMAESIVYVPACRKSAAAQCLEQDAQRVALCGTVPSYARIDEIQLYAQPNAIQQPWTEHRVNVEQDLGGARFTGKSFEYAQGGELKAVCVNFVQWSSDHPHIARVLIRYGFGEPPLPEPAPATPDPFETAAEPLVSTDAALVPQAAAITPAR